MSQKQQFDIAWKNILDPYFQDFLALLFPRVAKAIDWSIPPEFLDKELTTAIKGSASGSGIVDKLVKVRRKHKKDDLWILLHIEVQSQASVDFNQRMYSYYNRLIERYQKPVVSLAILADDNPNWRPKVHKVSLLGCRLRFEFVTLKLLDFQSREQELEASSNPFAMVILAHLATLETKGKGDHRLKVKLHLARLLYQKGWGKEAIFNLLNFINWILVLPEELEVEYVDQLKNIEQEKDMNFIEQVERIGINKGREEGIQEGIQEGMQKGRLEGRLEGRQEGVLQGEKILLLHLLQQKFGDLPSTIQTQLEQADSGQLLDWSNAMLTAHSLQDIFQASN